MLAAGPRHPATIREKPATECVCAGAYVANRLVAPLDYIYTDGISTERDEGYLHETWKWMRTGKTKTSKSRLDILLADQ